MSADASTAVNGDGTGTADGVAPTASAAGVDAGGVTAQAGAQSGVQGGQGAPGGGNSDDVGTITSLDDYERFVAEGGIERGVQSQAQTSMPEASASGADAAGAGGGESGKAGGDAAAAVGDGEGGDAAGDAGASGAEVAGAGEGAGKGDNPEGEVNSGADDADAASGKRKRVRIDVEGLTPLVRETIFILNRNRDLSLAEAEARAKQKLGIVDVGGSGSGATGSEGGGQSQTSQAEKDLAATRTVIVEKRAKAREAVKEMRFDEAATLQDELVDLQSKEFDLRLSVHQEQQAAQEAARKEAGSVALRSKADAVALYPDVALAGSKLVERMEEIDRDLEETGNPLFSDPNKFLRVAQMAANELGIAPRSKKAAVGAVKASSVSGAGASASAAPVVASKPAGGAAQATQTGQGGQAVVAAPPGAAPLPNQAFIMSGGARTAQIPAAQVLSGVLGKVSSLDDYEELVGQLGSLGKEFEGR
ncbi:hypothetical protein Ga0100231_004895 [Opitutaceae bacterium TAV4]|nr:hypothetical protein Ga0100231_004895 [Opitutaceae bacterium TAV4]RRK02333.1 hypothetical protein Ga0100230_004040 [Opitutaceae bacterium TAV3]